MTAIRSFLAMTAGLLTTCGPPVLSLGTDDAGTDAAAAACTCSGDLDGDGLVTYEDINPWRACDGEPAEAACARADLDCDGVIGAEDSAVLSCYLSDGSSSCCPDAVTSCGCNANVDRDADTDDADGAAVTACLDAAGVGACATADLDCSGEVDACDQAREACLLSGALGCCGAACDDL